MLQGAQRKEGGFGGGGVFWGPSRAVRFALIEALCASAGYREQQVPGQVELTALPALGKEFPVQNWS